MSKKMTLEQVRDWCRIYADRFKGWAYGMETDFTRMADAIDSHLATLPAAVPDAMKPHLFRETDDSEETARGEGYVEGWNSCREAMLTQRGDEQTTDKEYFA